MTPEEQDELLKRMEAEAEKRRIKYPIEVSGIKFEVDRPIQHESWQAKRYPPGSFVAIRPCAEECKDKTYLGILIGWVPIHTGASYNKETKELTFSHTGDNPAIFVFDLGRVVLGCESWWGAIKDETDLKEITNDDINNVWYVKAMKALAEKPKGE